MRIKTIIKLFLFLLTFSNAKSIFVLNNHKTITVKLYPVGINKINIPDDKIAILMIPTKYKKSIRSTKLSNTIFLNMNSLPKDFYFTFITKSGYSQDVKVDGTATVKETVVFVKKSAYINKLKTLRGYLREFSNNTIPYGFKISKNKSNIREYKSSRAISRKVYTNDNYRIICYQVVAPAKNLKAQHFSQSKDLIIDLVGCDKKSMFILQRNN